MYEFPPGLPNDLSFRMLGNQEMLGNCLNFIEWYRTAQSSCENENFVNTNKKLLKNRNETFLVVRYFAWKLELVSNILWMIVDLLSWARFCLF